MRAASPKSCHRVTSSFNVFFSIALSSYASRCPPALSSAAFLDLAAFGSSAQPDIARAASRKAWMEQEPPPPADWLLRLHMGQGPAPPAFWLPLPRKEQEAQKEQEEDVGSQLSLSLSPREIEKISRPLTQRERVVLDQLLDTPDPFAALTAAVVYGQPVDAARLLPLARRLPSYNFSQCGSLASPDATLAAAVGLLARSGSSVWDKWGAQALKDAKVHRWQQTAAALQAALPLPQLLLELQPLLDGDPRAYPTWNQTSRLITEHNAHVTDERGRTPLHYVATGGGRQWDAAHWVAKQLLDAGAEVAALDRDGLTPLLTLIDCWGEAAALPGAQLPELFFLARLLSSPRSLASSMDGVTTPIQLATRSAAWPAVAGILAAGGQLAGVDAEDAKALVELAAKAGSLAGVAVLRLGGAAPPASLMQQLAMPLQQNPGAAAPQQAGWLTPEVRDALEMPPAALLVQFGKGRYRREAACRLADRLGAEALVAAVRDVAPAQLPRVQHTVSSLLLCLRRSSRRRGAPAPLPELPPNAKDLLCALVAMDALELW